jgi:CBS domain-containing protein
MSLEQDLQHEKVRHLDLTQFTAVTVGTSVRDTVEQMRKNGHHSAIVTKDGMLAGIFTDRDLMRRVVDAPSTWDHPIEEVMTPSPLTVNSNDEAFAAMELMDEKHFRNVPVVDSAGKVVGNLTHYAIIKYLADRFPESIYNLPPESNQVANNRGGA